jgi:hypothetical protein
MGGLVMLIMHKGDSLWSKALFVVGPGLSFGYFSTMSIMSAYFFKNNKKEPFYFQNSSLRRRRRQRRRQNDVKFKN